MKLLSVSFWRLITKLTRAQFQLGYGLGVCLGPAMNRLATGLIPTKVMHLGASETQMQHAHIYDAPLSIKLHEDCPIEAWTCFIFYNGPFFSYGNAPEDQLGLESQICAIAYRTCGG